VYVYCYAGKQVLDNADREFLVLFVNASLLDVICNYNQR
jgi:hypothetical protein